MIGRNPSATIRGRHEYIDFISCTCVCRIRFYWTSPSPYLLQKLHSDGQSEKCTKQICNRMRNRRKKNSAALAYSPTRCLRCVCVSMHKHDLCFGRVHCRANPCVLCDMRSFKTARNSLWAETQFTTSEMIARRLSGLIVVIAASCSMVVVTENKNRNTLSNVIANVLFFVPHSLGLHGPRHTQMMCIKQMPVSQFMRAGPMSHATCMHCRV